MVKTYVTGTNRRNEVPKANAMGCVQRPSKTTSLRRLMTVVRNNRLVATAIKVSRVGETPNGRLSFLRDDDMVHLNGSATH